MFSSSVLNSRQETTARPLLNTLVNNRRVVVRNNIVVCLLKTYVSYKYSENFLVILIID